jgi:hypothetical protein
MNSGNLEIGVFVNTEAQPQDGAADSGPIGTWNHPALKELAALCSEESDLLNFDPLQLDRNESDRNQPSRPAGRGAQDLSKATEEKAARRGR